MNEILKTFLLAGDKFTSEMHFRQHGFTYNACGPFKKKKKKRIKKFKETGDSMAFKYFKSSMAFKYFNNSSPACLNDVLKSSGQNRTTNRASLQKLNQPLLKINHG